MNSAYEIFQKHAESNKQLYTVLRFACRCDSVTALTMNAYETASAFLSAKSAKIRVLNIGPVEESDSGVYGRIANELAVDFKMHQLKEDLEPTDLLYIDTPAEGNYRAMELGKYAPYVKKYIILPNTIKFALQPSPQIKLADDMKPIGLVFGVNHFLQTNDNWFILEHDDLDPGMTVLVNKDNATC
jgi:hypothetical protein